MAGTASERTQPGLGDSDSGVQCWCCGQRRPADAVLRLGEHPEVAVCLGCVHFLHQQARRLEDAAAPSRATRVRDGLRAARRLVMRRGWHNRPVIGAVLRRLGRRLP